MPRPQPLLAICGQFATVCPHRSPSVLRSSYVTVHELSALLRLDGELSVGTRLEVSCKRPFSTHKLDKRLLQLWALSCGEEMSIGVNGCSFAPLSTCCIALTHRWPVAVVNTAIVPLAPSQHPEL